MNKFDYTPIKQLHQLIERAGALVSQILENCPPERIDYVDMAEPLFNELPCRFDAAFALAQEIRASEDLK